MKYISTRGEAPVLGFKDVLLTGLARDGGLYIPETWPQFTEDQIAGFSGQTYQNVARSVLFPFIEGEIEHEDFDQMVDEAYASFSHHTVTPLVQIGPNDWVLELFHGPTLAFKDVAMQLLGRLMDHVLTERNQVATIVGATSGDTGGAAIEAFANRKNCNIFILFPRGKVSEVQQRQMTTVRADNVFPLAVDGNFDDCQTLVKAMFGDHRFRDRVSLSGVNSINWARIMAQIVYYFTSAVALGAPQKKVAFCVPTGNFGDIFAGYAASRMGLPIEKLIIATNANDILYRTFESGRYEMAGVFATQSPSMDIQISSNFERLLFESGGRNAPELNAMMSSLKQSGAFNLSPDIMREMRNLFAAQRCDEAQTTRQIQKLMSRTGYVADPHTAVGIHCANQQRDQIKPDVALVTLATAHPAKFPDAVNAACGVHPELPANLRDLMSREQKFDEIANDLETVEQFIVSKLGS